MSVPRILFAVPLLVVGMVLPAAGAHIRKPPSDTVGMNHEGFSTKEVTVHRGDRITFQNDSRWIHIIGPGKGGHLADPNGEPVAARLLMQTNNTYTTGTWNTAGTYSMTCSVHPEMTVKVIVTN